MKRALIGHTGFVGGNFAAQRPFEARFRSGDIESIAGQHFDLVVCAGAPGTKWLANQEPEADRAAVDRLRQALQQVTADRLVLVSTIDVFPTPRGVDETSAVADHSQAYGRHRRELEAFVADRFPSHLIVRLPGLFGPGLKKNPIYDLLHENRLDKLPSDGVFQFYDLSRLADDVDTCLAADLSLVHFATEPVSIAEIAREAFGRDFHNERGAEAPHYDLRTRHAAAFGRQGPYLASRTETLARIAGFVRGARR